LKTILTVVGARPQFIKAAAMSRALQPAILRGEVRHILVHTGQHYDANMSDVFFEELGIPPADINLGVATGSHGALTGAMLAGVEQVLLDQRPDWVLVYGDTNSTLAGCLAAVKLHISVAHVEAGLRSFNRRMPEEINRVLTDHASNLLLCPTGRAVENLHAEGIRKGVHLVGDVMFDIAMHYRDLPRPRCIPDQLGLRRGEFITATCHRAENTDDPARLAAIVSCINQAAEQLPVVLPLHPRTRARLAEYGLRLSEAVITLDPVGYLDMLDLQRHSAVILTDSGGVQKEAYILGVPCVTMRDETEWVETVEAGWNVLVGADPCKAAAALARADDIRARPRTAAFGDGTSSQKIISLLLSQ
jgi:UDP-GlcNAc3NAcA epimerase